MVKREERNEKKKYFGNVTCEERIKSWRKGKETGQSVFLLRVRPKTNTGSVRRWKEHRRS